MRRLISGIILFYFCVFLTACGAEKVTVASDERGSSTPVWSGTQENTQETAAEPERGPTLKYSMLVPCDETVYGSGNENGFYRVRQREDGAFNILFSDYDTCTEVYLCTEPNCAHDTEYCTAWLPPTNARIWPAVTEDTLYLLFSGSDLSKLEAADLDGSNRRTICTFESGRSLNPGVAYADGSLVLMTSDVDKETAVQSNALIEIDTHTGQVRPIYESASPQELAYAKGASYAFFLGVTDTGFLVKTITIGDDPGIQYHDVYEIPFGTDKQVSILSYQTGEMQSAAYSGGLAYLKNNVDSYEFGYIDTQTQEQHIVCPDMKEVATPYTFDDLFIRRFIGEWAIVNCMSDITVASNNNMELTYTCYAINMGTSEIKELSLSNHYNATTLPLEVYASFGNKLLVDAQVKEEKNSDGMMKRISTTLGIISVEDYLSSTANYSLINAEK